MKKKHQCSFTVGTDIPPFRASVDETNAQVDISFAVPNGFNSPQTADFSQISTIADSIDATPASVGDSRHFLRTLKFAPAADPESLSVPNLNAKTCHAEGRLVTFVSDSVDSASERTSYTLRLGYLIPTGDVPQLKVFAYYPLSCEAIEVKLIPAGNPHVLVYHTNGELAVLSVFPATFDKSPKTVEELERFAEAATKEPRKMDKPIKIEFEKKTRPISVCWHPNPAWSFVTFHRDCCAVWPMNELCYHKSSAGTFTHRVKWESDLGEKAIIYPFATARRVAKSVEIYSSNTSTANRQPPNPARIVIARRDDDVAAPAPTASEQYSFVDYNIQVWGEHVFLFILLEPNMLAVYHDNIEQDEAKFLFQGVHFITLPEQPETDFKLSSISAFPTAQKAVCWDKEFCRLTHAACINRKQKFKLSSQHTSGHLESKICIGFEQNSLFLILDIIFRVSQPPGPNELDLFFLSSDTSTTISLNSAGQTTYISCPQQYENGLLMTVTQGASFTGSQNLSLNKLITSLAETHSVSSFIAYWTHVLYISFCPELRLLGKLADPFLRGLMSPAIDGSSGSAPFLGISYALAYQTSTQEGTNTYVCALRLSQRAGDTVYKDHPAAEAVALMPDLADSDPFGIQQYSALKWYAFSDCEPTPEEGPTELRVAEGERLASPLIYSDQVKETLPGLEKSIPLEEAGAPEDENMSGEVIPTPPGFSSPAKQFATWDPNLSPKELEPEPEPGPAVQAAGDENAVMNETLNKLATVIASETKQGLREELQTMICQSLNALPSNSSVINAEFNTLKQTLDSKLDTLLAAKVFREEMNSLASRLEHSMLQTFTHAMSTFTQSVGSSMKSTLSPWISQVVEDIMTKSNDEMMTRMSDLIRTSLEIRSTGESPAANNKELFEYLDSMKESILLGHARHMATLQAETIHRVSGNIVGKFEFVTSHLDTLTKSVASVRTEVTSQLTGVRNSITALQRPLEQVENSVSAMRHDIKNMSVDAPTITQTLPESFTISLNKLTSDIADMRTAIESLQVSLRDRAVDHVKYHAEQLVDANPFVWSHHAMALRRHRHELDHDYRLHRPFSCNECTPGLETELIDPRTYLPPAWAPGPMSEYGGSQRFATHRFRPDTLHQSLMHSNRVPPQVEPRSLELPSSAENATSRRTQRESQSNLPPPSTVRLAMLAKADKSEPSAAIAAALLKETNPGVVLFKAVNQDNNMNTGGFWTLLVSRETMPRTIASVYKTPLVLGAAKLLADGLAEMDMAEPIGNDFAISANDKTEIMSMPSVLKDWEDVVDRLKWIQRALAVTGSTAGLLQDKEVANLKQLIFNRVSSAEKALVKHPKITNKEVVQTLIDTILEMCV
eukprot:Gregarina_sp_Poly_1__7997@NODE_458_length_8212_cov_59_372376_g373_i0_p1_GENE_NODE_458_length_8212_cov_59_372376_g373_i0NODE_458_length_8212_cov_59_372376_g373_i0_p1_ORF_typecomplete_len1370_score229_26AIP3/PF03915_13/0_00035DUF1664/PF07889_12/1_6e03DUF1664/PF07889_12/0_00029DUF1640/PF07798_11/13DUF1640/PF07798_11/0_0073Baculo_PEP_C/PF04513_12/11Baculo_PEP_C/PF04513_12/0_0032SFassemblin/PF06705_11/3_8SFassemblin/PF06705_11/1_1DUF4795/PF16043_5/0_035DUF4795/PF16043_5/8_4DUF4795/PF16043_5/80DUF4795